MRTRTGLMAAALAWAALATGDEGGSQADGIVEGRKMVANVGKFAELWWPVAGPLLLSLALGLSGVWAWTVRKRRPRVSRVVLWGLALYLLAGALGWAVFLSSEEGPRHPEWFGWGAEEAGEEVSP